MPSPKHTKEKKDVTYTSIGVRSMKPIVVRKDEYATNRCDRLRCTHFSSVNTLIEGLHSKWNAIFLICQALFGAPYHWYNLRLILHCDMDSVPLYIRYKSNAEA